MRNIPDEEDEAAYKKIVADHLNRLFGSKKSPEEYAFNSELLERGKFGPKIALKFLILLWVTGCIASMNYLMFYHQRTIKRCKIDVLEKIFTDEQISFISYEDNTILTSHCTVMDRNYTAILIESKYNYEIMMRKLDSMRPARNIKCKEMKTYNFYRRGNSTDEGVSYYDVYDLHCRSFFVKEQFRLLRYIGEALMGIPLGILSDLYGRMFVFKWYTFVLLSGLSLAYAPNIWCGCLARIMIGASLFHIIIYLVIFLETTSILTRQNMGFIVFVMLPISKILVYHVLGRTHVYYMRISMSICLIINHIYVIYFRRESVRWLFYRGKRQQAWRSITYPQKLPPNIEELSNEYTKVTLRSHMSIFFKFIFRLRTARVLCIVFSGSFISAYNMSRRTDLYRNAIWTHFYAIYYTLLLLIVAIYTLLMFMKRRIVLMTAYAMLVVCTAVSVLQNKQTLFLMCCEILQKALSQAGTYFIIYQVIELYPTPQRGTIIGMCITTMGISSLTIFHIEFYSSSNKKNLASIMMLVMAIICLVLISFIPNTTKRDLPDMPREALSSKILNVC